MNPVLQVLKHFREDLPSEGAGPSRPRPGATHGRPTCGRRTSAGSGRRATAIRLRTARLTRRRGHAGRHRVARRPRGRARAGETIWQVAKPPRHRDPAPVLLAGARLPADGNCRACMVEIEGERVLAASCMRKPDAGHEGQDRQRARQAARKLVFELLVADQPSARGAHDPTPRFWNWAERIEVADEPLPGVARRNRPTISAIRRWRCSSTPASSASCASAPAARCRSTT